MFKIKERNKPTTPILQRDHPCARGLQAAYLFPTPMDGRVIDYSGNARHVTSGLSGAYGNVHYTGSPYGTAIYNNLSNGIVLPKTMPDMFAAGLPCSVFFIAAPAPGTSVPWLMFSGAVAYNYIRFVGDRVDFICDTTTATDMQMWIKYPKSYADAGTWRTYGLSFEGNVTDANGARGYANGVEGRYDTRTNGTGSMQGSGGGITIGGGGFGATLFSAALFWNRLLSPGEFAELHNNPWRMWSKKVYLAAPRFWQDYSVFPAKPNVYEDIVVSESTTMSLDDFLSVSDDVTSTDVPNLTLVNNVDVSDDVAVSESVSMTLVHTPTISEDVTVAESVTMLTELNIDANDTITVAEDVTVQNASIIQFSISDDVSISESVNLAVVHTPSVSDAVTVSESVTLTNELSVNIFDGVSLSESISTAKENFVSVSDAISTSESVTAAPQLNITVNDGVALAEAITLVYDINISTIQEVGVSESAQMAGELRVSLYDGISVLESVASALAWDISVSEAVSVSESKTVEIFAIGPYVVIKGDIFLPGISKAEVFLPGTAHGEVFLPGSLESEVFLPGVNAGKVFKPGSIAAMVGEP